MVGCSSSIWTYLDRRLGSVMSNELRHLHKQEDHDWHMGRYGRCVYCDNGSRIATKEEINERL